MARIVLDRAGRLERARRQIALLDEDRLESVRDSMLKLYEAGEAFNDAWEAAEDEIDKAESAGELWTLTAAIRTKQPGETIVRVNLTVETMAKGIALF